MEKMFNKKQAGEFLNVSPVTIDRLRKNRKLGSYKIGDLVRFTESDLIAFRESCRTPSSATPSSREKVEMSKAVGGRT